MHVAVLTLPGMPPDPADQGLAPPSTSPALHLQTWCGHPPCNGTGPAMKPAVLIVREQWFDPHHLDRIAHRRALLALRLALPSTAWMIGWQAPCEHALAAFSELRICGAIDYPPDLDTLSRAIQAVLAGQLWFSHDVLQVLCLHALDTRKRTAPRTTTLTPRERTVLALTHRGLSPREIGRTLGLSQGRVRLYLETALDKQALVQQP